MGNKTLALVNLFNSSDDPTNNLELGDLYYNTSQSTPRSYDGLNFKNLSIPEITNAEMTTINNNNTASYGDLYYNIEDDRMYIGTVTGTLVDFLNLGGGGASSFNDLSDVTLDFDSSAGLITDDGKIPFFDFETGQFITDESITFGTSIIDGKTSVATSSIAKGLPVYIAGFDSDLHVVELADANGASTFPVVGFTAEPLDSSNSKHIITFGKLTGLNTTNTVSTLNPGGESWSVGEILFLSTTPGGLTKTRPTGGTTAIQRVAKVLRVDATGGQLFIFNTSRTAGVPNAPINQFYLGDTNGNPQTIEFTKDITIQEFVRTEILEVRQGLVVWVVPSSFNGYKITEFIAKVSTLNDNVTLQINKNGTLITGTSTTISTGTGSTVSSLTETLSTGDEIQIETTAIGVTPSEGLTVSIIMKRY